MQKQQTGSRLARKSWLGQQNLQAVLLRAVLNPSHWTSNMTEARLPLQNVQNAPDIIIIMTMTLCKSNHTVLFSTRKKQRRCESQLAGLSPVAKSNTLDQYSSFQRVWERIRQITNWTSNQNTGDRCCNAQGTAPKCNPHSWAGTDSTDSS